MDYIMVHTTVVTQLYHWWRGLAMGAKLFQQSLCGYDGDIWWRCPVQRWYVLTLSVAHVVLKCVKAQKIGVGDPFGGAKVIRIAGGVRGGGESMDVLQKQHLRPSIFGHASDSHDFPWIPMMQEVDPEERWVRSFLEWMESDYILFRCEFESFRVCQYFMVLSRKHVLICKLDMMTIRCDGRTLSRHNDVAVFPGLYGLFRTFRTVSPRNGGDRSLCAAMDLQERNIL